MKMLFYIAGVRLKYDIIIVHISRIVDSEFEWDIFVLAIIDCLHQVLWSS